MVMVTGTQLWYDENAPPREREDEEAGAMHEDLSPREREVAEKVAQGKTNAQIALETGLSPNTVKDYIASACRRLGLEGRVALAVWWVRSGHELE